MISNMIWCDDYMTHQQNHLKVGVILNSNKATSSLWAIVNRVFCVFSRMYVTPLVHGQNIGHFQRQVRDQVIKIEDDWSP